MTSTITLWPLGTLIGLTNTSFYSPVFDLAGFKKLVVDCREYGTTGVSNLTITVEFSQDQRNWDEDASVGLNAITVISSGQMFRFARCKVDIDDGVGSTFKVVARALDTD